MWQKAPDLLYLNFNEVHLWLVDCQPYFSKINNLFTILSPEEQAKADRFKFAIHRQRFIINRANLKIILSKYLQLKPTEIKFKYGSKGKPFLEDQLNYLNLKFNLSHSDNLAIYGISQDLIGVDLEKINQQVRYVELAERFFCHSEFKTISQLVYPQNYYGFYLAWTSKEAYLKATGEGLSGGLDSVELALNIADNKAKIIGIKNQNNFPNNWQLYNLKLDENFLLSVAIANYHTLQIQFYLGNF